MKPKSTASEKYNLVVVDDEKFICEIIKEVLSTDDRYSTRYFSSPARALNYINKHPVDLVLTDFFMGPHSGMDILETTRRCHPEAIVIIMTGHPTIENVISVLKLGAYDYIVKPFKLDTLKLTVERGLKAQRLAKENMHLKSLISLYQISEAMGSTIHLNSLLDLVLNSIVGEFNADLVSISLWDPHRDCLTLEAYYGDESDIKQNPLLSGKSEINYKVLKESRPQVVNELEDIPEQDVTSYISLVCHPLLVQGNVIGTLNLLRKGQFDMFGLGDIHLLWILASKAATAIEHSRLYTELEQAYIGTVRAFANAVEARDNYTRGHTERVYKIASLIARALDWPEEQMKHLYMGCVLHDIGKIGVPDSILNKPGRFTDEERRIMQMHPETGVKMLEGIPMLEPALPFILYHHEQYDGSGYPLGLKGKNIPIEGRVLAIADTVDAILTNRPYRKGASLEKVSRELTECSERQFDPELVEIFLEVLKDNKDEFSAIYGNVEEVNQQTFASSFTT
ncbi:MAG: response regulator [candidate division Zixibacteria bacterium]|nr:response regulator [candidate division Zixibacteria bacterium]